MTLVDWSDAESMFGLLLDYVAGAISENEGGRERQMWLSNLFEQLNDIETQLGSRRQVGLVARLREIHDSIDQTYSSDDVTGHLWDCIEELNGGSLDHDPAPNA